MSDTKIKYSVLMTVFNREPELLLATLNSLTQCDLSGVEVIVVNDCSAMQYNFAKAYLQANFENATWHDMEPYEAFRLESGFNNPSRAFNQAASMAIGDYLFIMSSDVLVPPRTMRKAKNADLDTALWTPYVEDTHGHIGGEYCGPNRLFPAPWFLCCSRQALLDVGGWDERYMGGLCYEDNDVVGRLACHVGAFIGDWSVKVFHQGHVQQAYMDLPGVADANARNRELTMTKWKGIPFEMEFTPFTLIRKMHPSGNMAHWCQVIPGRLEEAIASTEGLMSVPGVHNASRV